MRLTLDSLCVGSETSWVHRISLSDVEGFAKLSGDTNPLHMDREYARRQGFSGRVVHGMLLGAFLSRVLGTDLPGTGVLWLSQDTRFLLPVYIDDEIRIVVRVKHKSDALRTLLLETVVLNQHGGKVLQGEAKVMVLEQPCEPAWEDTVALVTGSSRGIGASIALAFGRKRAKVAVHYHSRRESAEEVVAGIHALGGEAALFAADLLHPAGPHTLAEAVRERFGGVQVLVNNASPAIRRAPPESVQVADLDFYWNAYVRSSWLLMQELLPGMKAAGFGRIVQILSSAISGTPPADLAAYVAAKSGLWGLSKALAVDLAPRGITVNAVSPSAVMTDQWEGVPDSHRRALAMRVPMRTLASPNDVANAVVHLASPEARYLTGQNVLLAGGELM